MGDVTRLELSAGSSNKFWEVSTRGTELRVRFGRYGTQGQTKLKHYGTPAQAKAASEKLKAEKLKKGYSVAGRSNGKAKAKPKPASEGPKALAVVKEFDMLGAIWKVGKEVWFVQVDADDEEVRAK